MSALLMLRSRLNKQIERNHELIDINRALTAEVKRLELLYRQRDSRLIRAIRWIENGVAALRTTQA